MKFAFLPIALAAAFILGAGAAAESLNGGKPQQLASEPLTISGPQGKHHFTMEVAKDEPAREIGLMYRKTMADNHGMIFVFDTKPPVRPAFWMHETYIPLDIIFVGLDGRILNIAKNAKPLDETPLPAAGAARAVIEINGGLADRLHIQPGDRVEDEAAFGAAKP